MHASCCAWMRELRNWRSKTGFKKNSKTENSKTQPSFCVELIIRESVRHERESVWESIGWKRVVAAIVWKRGCCLNWLGAGLLSKIQFCSRREDKFVDHRDGIVTHSGNAEYDDRGHNCSHVGRLVFVSCWYIWWESTAILVIRSTARVVYFISMLANFMLYGKMI